MPKLIGDVVPAGTVGGAEQPILTMGAGLVLRPFADSDAPVVVAAFATPDIQYFHFRSLDLAEAQQWIAAASVAWNRETAATWAIVDRATDEVLGRVTMYLVLAEGRAEVSYWVLPAARGRGVATRACVVATAWVHGIGVPRVELQHSVDNDASLQVARRAGFVQEGVKRRAQLLTDGWHDMVLHSHLDGDV